MMLGVHALVQSNSVDTVDNAYKQNVLFFIDAIGPNLSSKLVKREPLIKVQ